MRRGRLLQDGTGTGGDPHRYVRTIGTYSRDRSASGPFGGKHATHLKSRRLLAVSDAQSQ